LIYFIANVYLVKCGTAMLFLTLANFRPCNGALRVLATSLPPAGATAHCIHVLPLLHACAAETGCFLCCVRWRTQAVSRIASM
jgi:hypothetical protein